MRLYPLGLKIEGKKCVVVGGGAVAARKVTSLLECGAKVTVISPKLTSELEELTQQGAISVARHRFQPDDLAGARLAIAATDERGVNESVVAAAHHHRALVNVVDVPNLCDFYVPASVNRGGLQITVSTSGSAPALAKKLRQRLEDEFGLEYAPYLEMLARLREQLQEQVVDPERRKAAVEAFLASPALALLVEGKTDSAELELERCLAQALPAEEEA